MMRLLLSLIFAFTLTIATAGEGMWLPLLLKALNEGEMQSMGMKMTAEDIYSVNAGSLKDAIVHFGGFCTGEVISANGLVLTNHHCGYGAIQSHSTVDNNLLKDGFWAMNRQEEIPTPGLFVRFIVRIEDVTDQVLQGVTDSMTGAERQSLVDQNSAALDLQREEYQDFFVAPFFHGNQYFAFVTETYTDVRLVGAPPESIGKFGADTDNWVWPRHTGDFSLFRIYAGPDNKPADYSEENIPFKPRHHLPISLDGVEEGDFTLVFGFPGRTNQYAPSAAIQQLIDVIDPARIAIRDISLKIMDKYMRADEAIRLKYASRFAGVANSWKKWIGERQGLIKTGAVALKVETENAFNERVAASAELQEKYGDLTEQFNTLYEQQSDNAYARTMYSETFFRGVQLFNVLSRLERLQRIYQNSGEEQFRIAAEGQMDYFNAFYDAYEPAIDEDVCYALLEHFVENMPEDLIPDELRIVPGTEREVLIMDVTEKLFAETLVDREALSALLQLNGEQFSDSVDDLYAREFFKSVQNTYAQAIAPGYEEFSASRGELQRVYMRALMEVFPEKTFWPDANSTLRVTYGYAEGYSPRDAVEYEVVTHLDGVMEKYVPGDYEFDVHPKLIELYENKDYGKYADASNGQLPVCFIGSNHTSGGNSGSPAIDGSGNLVGLNFDRVWEGTMSDYHYDRSICRNIMVDARYILFVIDKFAGASHLIDEMDLVHPKGTD